MVLNSGLNITNNNIDDANDAFGNAISDLFNSVFGKIKLPEINVGVTLPENTVKVGLTPTVILIMVVVFGFILIKN